jgi:hypothetical protein
MRQVLKLHPDSRCSAVGAIAVEVTRPGPFLVVRFLVSGVTSELVLPPPAGPLRTDGLWRHTCFEAFARAPSGSGYLELNLSPSTAWAAYRFEDYRVGMAPAEGVADPGIVVTPDGDGFDLSAAVVLPGLPANAPWRVGFSAVIEERDGHTSYWALAHPPGRPDFHHADCFALELPAVQDA